MRCPRAYKLKIHEGVVSRDKHLSLCKSIATKQVILWIHNQNECPEMIKACDIENECERCWKQEIDDPRVCKQELAEIVNVAKTATKNNKAVPATSKNQKLLSDIKNWCLRYVQLQKDVNVIHSNIAYECEIGDLTFTGFIDQIRQDNDGNIQIMKLRTSSQTPSNAYMDRDFSLTLAAYATWKGYFFPNRDDPNLKSSISQIPEVFYYYLPFLDTYKRNGKKKKKGEVKGDPLISSPKSKKRLLEFEYEILQIVAGIEMGYFPMRVVQPVGCCLCSYRHQCNSFTSEHASDYLAV